MVVRVKIKLAFRGCWRDTKFRYLLARRTSRDFSSWGRDGRNIDTIGWEVDN